MYISAAVFWPCATTDRSCGYTYNNNSNTKAKDDCYD